MIAKRLLVVIDEMEVGGSQRQIVHLLAALDRSKWQPELVYFRSTSFLADTLRAAGIPVHHLPKRRRIDPHFALSLARLLRNGRYDLIHAYSLTAEWWTLLASRSLRDPPPLVSSVRSLNLHAPWWHWRLKRIVLRHSSATIANAQAAARVAADHGRWPLRRLDVIGNGVVVPQEMDAAERARCRAELGVPEGRVFGLFVGRLTGVKNLPCLLDAVAALSPAQRPWMALAGDGPQRASIARQVGESGLEASVALLGNRSDATALMQAADFLVLCSDQEASSNALLEAMAAGCPVIASDVGGNPELVEHERTGLLFAANDAQALSLALARMVDDSALRTRLSASARDRAQAGHGIPALVNATTKVYERCLAASGPGMRARIRIEELQR